MNDLLHHEPLIKAWKDFSPKAQRVLKDFAKTPTIANQAYAIGYIAALRDNSVISSDTYSYMLSIFGQLPSQNYIMEAIREL